MDPLQPRPRGSGECGGILHRDHTVIETGQARHGHRLGQLYAAVGHAYTDQSGIGELLEIGVR